MGKVGNCGLRIFLQKHTVQMTVHLKRQLFTVKEYYKMAEMGILKPSSRVELLNGEIIQISPIKSYHAAISTTH